jgi:hypothetical protein
VSYGVNRAKPKTRRKKRRASNGPARSAGKSKRRGTRTKSAGRARSTAKATRRKRTTTPKRKSKPKKAKLYTRYDPETGQKVRVTADSYEYTAWLSRKPSKKKQTRAALKSDPVGTLGILGATAGKKAVERAGERAASGALRAGRGRLVAAATALATSSTVGALAAAGAVGAAIYAMGKLAEAYTVSLGERANQISRQFVATQQQVIKQYGGSRWEDVPADLRNKLVNGYKAAIQKVYAFQPIQGTVRPSQQIPYGR